MQRVLIAALILAQQPKLLDVANWLSPEDYPPEAVRNAWEGVVSYEVDVASDGKALGCKITKTSGYPVLDQRTCQIFLSKGQFSPARDEHGRAMRAIKTGVLRWVVPASAITAQSVTVSVSNVSGAAGCIVHLPAGDRRMKAMPCSRLAQAIRAGGGSLPKDELIMVPDYLLEP